MSESKPEPGPLTTDIAAVILGASSWPDHPNLTASEAFQKSAERFRSYLLDANGLGLREANLLWLFDNNKSADEIDRAIGDFLKEKGHEAPAQLTDVIIYYTGHGGFTEGDDKYFLAIRATRKNFTGSSGYRMSSLARTLNTYASNVRRFVILDCCFAARALEEFIPQSEHLQVMQSQTLELLPETGTALLCAASSDKFAKVPKNHPYTMFSGALLKVLENGVQTGPDRLSLAEVGDLTKKEITNIYLDLGVRPEIHSPAQQKGDIAKVPIFPNPAIIQLHITERIAVLEKQIIQVVDPKLETITQQFNSLIDKVNRLESDIRLEKGNNRKPNYMPFVEHTYGRHWFFTAIDLIAGILISLLPIYIDKFVVFDSLTEHKIFSSVSFAIYFAIAILSLASIILRESVLDRLLPKMINKRTLLWSSIIGGSYSLIRLISFSQVQQIPK
jgi:hypothetical protein